MACQSVNILAGTYEVIDSVETVWQLPEESQIKGLVLIAHGSCHGAIDWWPHTDTTPKCIGLPEELRIVSALLAAGWAVIAMSSALRVGHRSWDFRTDGPRVRQALQTFRTEHKLNQFPLAGLGISSGGAFVQLLPQLMPIDCIIVQIMALPPRAINLKSMAVGSVSRAYPPTLFITMKRDCDGPIRASTDNIEANIAALRDCDIRVSHVVAQPLPVTRTFFSDRIDGVPPEVSSCVRDALLEGALLDSAGMVREDPRTNPDKWRSVLRAADSGKLMMRLPGNRTGVADTFESDLSPIAELLNTAYCQHEITADHMDETIDWLNMVIA